MAEWISVEDRLPAEEGYYLVCIDNCGEIKMEVMELVKYRNSFNWANHIWSWWQEFNTITHWMPLPELPTIKE